jgi:hypothetical protein
MNKIKSILILVVWYICLTSACFAQNNQPVYGLFGYEGQTAPSTMMLGDAAIINAESNLVLNQSQANINNQTAYSMMMHNNILRVQTFFETRQMNRFYRDLEEWQKQERSMLKRSGLYDREAIEYIYGIHR